MPGLAQGREMFFGWMWTAETGSKWYLKK